MVGSKRRPANEIAADLRAGIETGSYPPGAKLPSRSELARQYGVAQLTVSHALAQLRAEGLVISKQGSGSYVRQPAAVIRAARSRLARAERAAGRGAFATDAHSGGWTARSDVTVRAESASPEIAAALGINTGADVLVRDRVMYADDTAVQLATSYLPAAITTPAMSEPDTGPGGLYARLEEAGHELTSFEETVRIGFADSTEAAALGVVPGVAVFRLRRTAFAAGRPVEINQITMLGDRYELVYDLPAR